MGATVLGGKLEKIYREIWFDLYITKNDILSEAFLLAQKHFIHINRK